MANLGGVRARILVLICLLLLVPLDSADSFPNGVNSVGDNGCSCHGASNNETEIMLEGLPDRFESNTTYSLTLNISNQAILASEGSAQGGFRIIIDGGTLDFSSEQGQQIDGGWTHKESSNQQRSWDFSWFSPDDNTTMARLLIYANAVNGNQASSGDNWHSIEIYIPGSQNNDPLPNQVSALELDLFDKTMLFSGILLLMYIGFRIIRD